MFQSGNNRRNRLSLVKGSFILHTLYCQTFSTSMLFVILKIEGEVKRKGTI